MEISKNDVELSSKIYNINGIDWIPVADVWFFTPYTYSWVRTLIAQNKIPKTQMMSIKKLNFIRVSYLKNLRIMKNDPEKWKQMKYNVDQYYLEKDKKIKKKDNRLTLV